MIQRRAVAGFLCAATFALIAGCAYDSPDVEDTEHAEIQGATFTTGPIHVAAANVAASSTGALNVVVTFVNDGAKPDTLTAATSSAGTFTITSASGGSSVTLPPGIPVQLVDPALSSSGATMTLTPKGVAPSAGAYIPIVFDFAQAGASVSAQVPVVPPGETTGTSIVLPTTVATSPSVSGPTSD